MAILTAKVGKVMIGAIELKETDNASLAITIDSGETTSIGQTWKTVMALGKSWTLSCSCKHNSGDSGQSSLRDEFISGDGEIADVKMYEDDSVYFSGPAVITSFNVTKAVGAIDTLSVTLEGDSTLSYSG